MTIFLGLNLALRFVLEICILVALGTWGFSTDTNMWIRFVLGLGIPIVAACIWAMFGAPNSLWELQPTIRLLLELFLFGSAILALYASGRSSLAIALLVVVVINRVLMFVFHQ